MSELRLNWAEASVDGGRLTVALEGDPDKQWKEGFKRTVRLLGSGDWGDVEFKKRAVRVDGVREGSEAKLRHHLESIVEQANAAVREDGDERTAKREPERSDEDARMTERFREFAEQEAPDE